MAEPSQAEHTSQARLEAAAALRELGNALIAHQPDDALLGEVARLADAMKARVSEAPPRPHAFLQPEVSLFERPMATGHNALPRTAFPDSIVSGKANPLSFGADVWREEDRAVLNVTLGPACEGVPGRAHGGAVAALFDEMMGFASSIEGSPAFTGRLTITYRAPTPVGVPLVGQAWISERAERTLEIRAELRHDEQLLVEAKGHLVKVDVNRFLARFGAPTARD